MEAALAFGGAFEACEAGIGAVLICLGIFLVDLWPSGDALGCSWDVLGRSGSALGPFVALLRATLGRS